MNQQERATILEHGPLVLYDGVCALCNGSVRFLAPRDRTGRLHFAPIQSEAGQKVLRRHGMPLTDWQSFVFLDSGEVHLKSSACLRIICYMSGAWPALRVFRILPRGVLDWFYDRVAANRYALFGRHEDCLMPTEALQAKFLD
jgi:predicted DCC family thiol-disulfide oxidoreductase YuxK